MMVKQKFVPIQRNPALDGLRGLAALLVMFHHVYWFVDLKGPIEKIGFPYIGPVAVFCFFVLSSYLLTYRGIIEWQRVLQSKTPDGLTRGRFWTAYLIRRFFRVYPLYFIVTWGIIAFQAITNMQGRMRFVWWEQIFLVYPKGIYWTISVEMEYYLLIPLVVLLYVRAMAAKKTFPGRFLAVLFLLGVSACSALFFPLKDFPLVYPHIVPYLPSFIFGSLAGIAVYEYRFGAGLGMPEKVRQSIVFVARLGTWIFAVALVFLLPFYLNLVWGWHPPASFLPVYRGEEFYWRNHTIANLPGIFAAFLILGIALSRGKGFLNRLLKSKLLTFAGKASFSIYVLHINIGFVLKGFFMTQETFQMQHFWLYGVLTFAISIALSTLSFAAIEKPFMNLGSRVINKWIAKPTQIDSSSPDPQKTL